MFRLTPGPNVSRSNEITSSQRRGIRHRRTTESPSATRKFRFVEGNSTQQRGQVDRSMTALRDNSTYKRVQNRYGRSAIWMSVGLGVEKEVRLVAMDKKWVEGELKSLG